MDNDPRTATAACEVTGSGVLAEAVRRLSPPGDPVLLVSAADTWATGHHSGLRKAAEAAGLPWLPVRAELGAVIVGPLETPGEPGCHDCLETRRRRAHSDPAGFGRLRELHGPALAERPSRLLTTLAADSTAALVAEEARLLASGARPRTHGAMLRLDLARLTVERHRFLADPLCPTCGTLPEDSAELATAVPVPRPVIAPGTTRTRAMLDELDTLRELYVDREAGMIPEIASGTDGGLVMAVAPIRLRGHEDRPEPGIGRTHSHRTSTLVGLLEALERYGGVRPGGRRTTVTGSYRELSERAVDPRSMGLHPAESHTRDSFPFRVYDPDAECSWVWGHSFARGGPVLVPESAAYACVHGPWERRPFFSETSNGCALGGCWEEAVLHGLLEVAERDAFLMTWYGQLPVPALDLDTCLDRRVPLQAAAITAATGHRIQVFDTTMEHGIPTAWALALAPGADGPRTVSSAGAALTLEGAALNALAELGPIITDLVRRYGAGAEDARRMADDAGLVTEMGHHALLYGTPEAAERLSFLGGTTPPRCSTGSGPVRTAADDAETVPRGPLRHDDLTESLREAVARFAAAGMDTIVVDQTTPEHQAGGLACVKVLAPGALPMTFGHHLRRTEGLTRLSAVPHLLGHSPRPLRPDELNPHPHPFP